MIERDAIVIGTQRVVERSQDECAAWLDACVSSGVHWLDTAAPYGSAPGDGERAVARVAGPVRVMTKGGLVRSARGWRPDGRAKHLAESARESCARLGVEVLDLFLLHLPDPRTPWDRTLRALQRLVRDGVARAVGLCNVTVAQARAARDLGMAACVQVPFSPFDRASVRSGIVEWCLANGVPVLAHRPLGGVEKVQRLERDAAVVALAEARGVGAAELVLAWIRDLGLVPVPGPTQESTLASCVRSARLVLTEEERAGLDARWPWAARLRVPRATRAPDPSAPGEVRLIMGSPGAGKSTQVHDYVARGFVRLNRDERGGTLAKLVRALDRELDGGARHVVLDNTYPSRAQRYDVIETAWAHGVPVRVTWLDPPPGDCERNVVERVLDLAGHLPEPATLAKPPEPGIVGPRALLHYRARLEAPELEEGFAALEQPPFVRTGAARTRRGLVCDPSHLEAFGAVLEAAAGKGWAILVAGWEPDADPEAWAAAIQQRAPVSVHASVCPHPAGPPVCWCRKPWVGLVVAWARAEAVDLAQCVIVATKATDRTLAAALGCPTITDPSDPLPE